jgi:hypothetical protein
VDVVGLHEEFDRVQPDEFIVDGLPESAEPTITGRAGKPVIADTERGLRQDRPRVPAPAQVFPNRNYSRPLNS